VSGSQQVLSNKNGDKGEVDGHRKTYVAKAVCVSVIVAESTSVLVIL
jgi:hypothetical protein